MHEIPTRPTLLRCDNFTPPSRTPWGGRRIVEDLKAGLPLAADKAAYPIVGEAWEISVDPAFPSVLASDRLLLADALAADPHAWLGEAGVARFGPSTPMLVKLLDSADELSVQVHPADDYPRLAPGESGKPECWYVLGAEPGAGIYLGLAEGVERETLARGLREGADISPLLQFVPVSRGEVYIIGPGTVHAIGRGVTLVEPQLVVPGRTGKTYRFWDWNRRYDAQGRRAPAGSPRELHVEHSLAVTRFDGPRGEALVDSLRSRPRLLASAGDATHEHLADLSFMHVERLRGSGTLRLPARDALMGVVVVGGSLRTHTRSGVTLDARYGRSFVIPASAGALDVALDDAEAIVTWCR